MSRLKELELELDGLKDTPENKRRRSTLKAMITKEKKKMVKPSENVIQHLNALFTLDEGNLDDDEDELESGDVVNVDDIINVNMFREENDIEQGAVLPKDSTSISQTHTENSLYGDNQSHDEDLSVDTIMDLLPTEQVLFLKNLIEVNGITEDLDTMSLKFMYFLKSRNLAFANMSPQTIKRFIKIYPHYLVTQIYNELKAIRK